MPFLPVEELSVSGLFNRIDDVERIKKEQANGFKLDEDKTDLLQSEADAKKAIGEALAECDSKGLTHKEAQKAKAFLQAQLKAIEPDSKGAAARKAKLSEMLESVGCAAQKEEPAHVAKARAALKKHEKDYGEVQKIYEKWEKGKQKFNSVDELNAMKRSYEDSKKVIAAAQAQIELEVNRKPAVASAKPAAPVVRGAPRPKIPVVSAPGNPAARPGGAKAKASANTTRWIYKPFNNLPMTLRQGPWVQGQMAEKQLRPGDVFEVAEERWDDQGSMCFLRLQDGRGWTHDRNQGGVLCVPADPGAAAAYGGYPVAGNQPPVAAKPRKAPDARKQKEEPVVLSYNCTVSAAAQVLGLSKDKIKEMAESSSEIRNEVSAKYGDAKWKEIQDKSVAIEKDQKLAERQKELQKQQAKIAKQTERMLGPTDAALPAANRAVGAPKAKAKAAAKGAGKGAPKIPTQSKNINKLATGNNFAGMESSSDEDGFTTVKKGKK